MTEDKTGKEEEKEKPLKKDKKERRIERELLGIVVFILVLLAVFLVSSYIFKSFNTFEYEGLTFVKERAGEIPIFHYTYYFMNKQGGLIQYNLYIRNDPRANNIPVFGDNITLDAKKVFIAIDSKNLQECRQSVLAVGDLTSFLTDNQLKVEGGNLDFWNSGLKRQDWVTCENKENPEDLVIEIKESNETKITINEGCYVFEIADCQILETVEKFKVQSILDS